MVRRNGMVCDSEKSIKIQQQFINFINYYMEAKTMINQIKTLLGVEIELAQTKLANGTIVEAEELKAGQEIFIVTEDEKIAMPVGSYELEDGTELTVEEEGIIASLGEKKDEEPVDEELADEKEKEEMGYATKEELAEVKSMVEDIKAMIEKDHKKDEMSEEQPEENVEELSEQTPEETVEEQKEELSAVEKVTHNPEVEQKKTIKLGQNRRTMTTHDIVMQRISQINK
jgi:hypothetical protein